METEGNLVSHKIICQEKLTKLKGLPHPLFTAVEKSFWSFQPLRNFLPKILTYCHLRCGFARSLLVLNRVGQTGPYDFDENPIRIYSSFSHSHFSPVPILAPSKKVTSWAAELDRLLLEWPGVFTAGSNNSGLKRNRSD